MSREPRRIRERERMEEARAGVQPWKKWGPYLSERQWGTVRENLNPEIEAWNDLTHDQARSRAYRNGEDGLAGFCDDRMLLCFSLALWNGKDPILKERLFGLTNREGNHGEDVKESYFYLDSTPTHSYAKMLYKYPQAAYPYDALISENRRRTREQLEYELIDTGVFDGDRYWDVFVEFAKSAPEDVLVKITAFNRGPEAATLHVLPQFLFRNTWIGKPDAHRPELVALEPPARTVVLARHADLGLHHIYCQDPLEILFTDNETNHYRLWGQANPTMYQKDGINDHVVQGRPGAVNPDRRGTKMAAHHVVTVAPGQSASVQLRFGLVAPAASENPFGATFAEALAARKREADDFYADLVPPALSADAANVARQSCAGLLWTKQAYVYDVESWLGGQGSQGGDRALGHRNANWMHLYGADIISMPDKWEYPWFAAWDLAFHALAFAPLDPDFAWRQLDLMLTERYQHPNGQIPAYEWNFDDANPPVHAWATLFYYRLNRSTLGDDATLFLKRSFHMLTANFMWWVNRKDRDGHNLFEGGFLGLDNIGVFDRSAPLPTGGYLEQADGTAWMAFFAQNMLDISLELALVDPSYEDVAIKFYEEVIRITYAISRDTDRDAMWDEEDGFFYDVLRVPGQWATRLKVRSLVGLLPLCAVTVYHRDVLTRLPRFVERVRWFNHNRADLLRGIHQPGQPGVSGRFLLSLLDEEKLHRVLARMLDPQEFLSDHGIRSLSRYHLEHPYVFRAGQREYRVQYTAAESDNGMFGGNSNWRGPIWAPTNALIIRALLNYYSYYGDEFRVECPTGSGQYLTLYGVALELSNRMSSLFLRNHEGLRPVYGGQRKFSEDPHFRDYVLFYEYFHGDNGAGLGASHQTGWTAIIPALMNLFAKLTPEMILASEQVVTELGRHTTVIAPGASP